MQRSLQCPVVGTDGLTGYQVCSQCEKCATPSPTASPTAAPTTGTPTTATPTEAPTTAAPTTDSPTSAAPTEAPTTAAPTTGTPTTASPTTNAPTTASPTVHYVSWGLDVSEASLTITVGDTVVWQWDQGGSHNLVSGTRDSPTTDFGSGYNTSGSFTHTFLSTGTFHYHCTSHFSMDATITVISPTVTESTVAPTTEAPTTVAPTTLTPTPAPVEDCFSHTSCTECLSNGCVWGPKNFCDFSYFCEWHEDQINCDNHVGCVWNGTCSYESETCPTETPTPAPTLPPTTVNKIAVYDRKLWKREVHEPEKTVAVAVAIEFDASTAAGIALEYKNNLIAGGINESDIILIAVSKGSTTFYSEGGNRRRRSSGGDAQITTTFSTDAVTTAAAQISGSMTVSGQVVEVIELEDDDWCPDSNETATITSFEGTTPGSGCSFFTNCTHTATHLIIQNASIPDNAFSGCATIWTVQLGASVTSIPDGAFRNNYNLRNVTGGNITSMGDNSFARAERLSSINLEGVQQIGERCFQDMGRFISGRISIASSTLTSIGPYAFYSSQSSKIESAEFSVLETLNTGVFLGCTRLENVSLPAVTSIGERGFQACPLTGTVLFGDVTSLGQRSFEGSNLINASFPLIGTVPDFAFSGCVDLLSVDISSATSIGRSAFSGCSALTTVISPSFTSMVGQSYNAGFGTATSLHTIDLTHWDQTLSDRFSNETCPDGTFLPGHNVVNCSVFTTTATTPTTTTTTTLVPTPAPTTASPTTAEPTTAAPAPTTGTPTTASPTLAPTILAPTTLAPTTLAPTRPLPTLPPTTHPGGITIYNRTATADDILDSSKSVTAYFDISYSLRVNFSAQFKTRLISEVNEENILLIQIFRYSAGRRRELDYIGTITLFDSTENAQAVQASIDNGSFDVNGTQAMPMPLLETPPEDDSSDNTVIIAVAAVLGVLLGFGYFLYRRQKRKENTLLPGEFR